MRQFVLLGRFDLAAHLPQFGFDVIKPQLGVNFLFRFARHRAPALQGLSARIR